MPSSRLRRYGSTLTRFFGEPEGIPYVVGVSGAVKSVVGSFDPVHERETSGDDGFSVIVRQPCLTVHPDLLDFSPARGDTFEVLGQVWFVQTTEQAGMGSIRCWSEQRLGVRGDLPFTTP